MLETARAIAFADDEPHDGLMYVKARRFGNRYIASNAHFGQGRADGVTREPSSVRLEIKPEKAVIRRALQNFGHTHANILRYSNSLTGAQSTCIPSTRRQVLMSESTPRSLGHPAPQVASRVSIPRVGCDLCFWTVLATSSM